MDEPTKCDQDPPKSSEQIEFKKPILIGKIGKLPRKAKTGTEKVTEVSNKEVIEPEKESSKEGFGGKSNLPPAVLLKELSTPIPYKEPKWSGLCPDGSDYGLEVLKSGLIVDKIDLLQKPYFVFGRLANCDVVMAHPTVSRHHAILQYKAISEEGEPPVGWYLYDLGSTHGTFLNKDKLKPSHYTRVRVGHQIKFGTSTRTYIVLGPDFDCEGESELTVTEIKQRTEEMKKERDRMIQEAIEQRKRDKLEEEKRREEQGIDWGMGDDAEEEPDLADNPYASTANEELYLDDPKKTLRGYFEREGLELKYDCDERGIGQFMCRVELPIDDSRGNPVFAEVMHRGKKKEAVVACALEACRILDRAGLLRQAKHESRRRKQRDWSADDYYDSDEDTFLDRTGAVERKRNIRMQKHGIADTKSTGRDKAFTYDDLLKQIKDIETKMAAEEKCLERLRSAGKKAQDCVESNEDALDQFMSSLGKQGQTMAQKAEISQTKMNIQKLKAELAKTQRLAEIARPAHIPPLIKKDESKMPLKMNANSVIYGKRIRLKTDQKRPKVHLTEQIEVKEDTEFVEEMDSDDEEKVIEDSRVNVQAEKESTEELSTERIENGAEKSEGEQTEVKRVYGPMRPPENYVMPESYFEQNSDRDLPEIMEKED